MFTKSVVSHIFKNLYLGNDVKKKLSSSIKYTDNIIFEVLLTQNKKIKIAFLQDINAY